MVFIILISQNLRASLPNNSFIRFSIIFKSFDSLQNIKRILMKTIVLSCLFILISYIVPAQSQQDAVFNKVFGKLVSDYPQAFKNIRGELILEDEDEQRFISKIELPGAQDCLISLPLSGEKKQAKWEAFFFSSASFEEAAKEYKNLHQQLMKVGIKLNTKSTSRLKGTYESPVSDDSFTISVYSLSPSTGAFRRVRIELELVHFLDEWRVNLRIGDQEISE